MRLASLLIGIGASLFSMEQESTLIAKQAMTPLGAARSSQKAQTEQKPPVFYESEVPMEIDFSLALDDFRGIPNGTWQNAYGFVGSANFVVPMPESFFLQAAGSYGLYEWAGRASAPVGHTKNWQQQGFLTIAASRIVEGDSGVNAGIAYDWMFNRALGAFAVNPSFDQVRAQIGYLIQGGNEVGALVSYGIQTDNKESISIPLKFRGISQANIFWCHYFKSKGFGMLWVGSPYRRGLMFSNGRAGRFIVGAQFQAPVMKHLSFYGHAVYMSPRGGSGFTPSGNYDANLCFGLTYSFGHRRMAASPYMTLANNSNFLIDANQNF